MGKPLSGGVQVARRLQHTHKERAEKVLTRSRTRTRSDEKQQTFFSQELAHGLGLALRVACHHVQVIEWTSAGCKGSESQQKESTQKDLTGGLHQIKLDPIKSPQRRGKELSHSQAHI